MSLKITTHEVRGILTRTGGFLRGVVSHSLQPYRGCSFGKSMCGVGCYVQHNHAVTRGSPWGTFLEVRPNAAYVYAGQFRSERRWARKNRGCFGIFMSSSTDPFLPQEDTYQVSHRILQTMLVLPPDALILQTHSHRVLNYLELYGELQRRCNLRFHISIECDRDRIPGLPPPASSVEERLQAAGHLRSFGLTVFVTVAPLLPIVDAERFFRRIAEVADAVIIDHFVGGDGSRDGHRTRKTALPEAMERAKPGSCSIDYLGRTVAVASRIMPGRVGTHSEGFAGRLIN